MQAAPFQLERVCLAASRAVRALCLYLGNHLPRTGRCQTIGCYFPLSADRFRLISWRDATEDEVVLVHRCALVAVPSRGCPVGLNRADLRQGMGI